MVRTAGFKHTIREQRRHYHAQMSLIVSGIAFCRSWLLLQAFKIFKLRCSPSPTPAVASVLINGMMRFDTIATSSSEDDKRFSIFDRVPNPFFAARPLYLSSLPQSHYTQRTYHKSHSSALHRRRRSAFIISEEQRDDRHLQFSRKPGSYIQSTDSIDIVV